MKFKQSNSIESIKCQVATKFKNVFFYFNICITYAVKKVRSLITDMCNMNLQCHSRFLRS